MAREAIPSSAVFYGSSSVLPDTDWKGSLIGFIAGATIRAEVALPQGDKV